jgi:farnesyl diphosphate synthase
MHIHKTGALIRAAVLLGAHCGEAAPARLDASGPLRQRIGLLFQVVDDILDAEASTATLGKTAGKDAAQQAHLCQHMMSVGQAKAMPKLRQDAHDASNRPSATRPCACTNWPTSSSRRTF